MRQLCITLLLLIAAATTSRAQYGQLFASDRLSSTNITCITQDKVGYIWVGTEYGLNRFDGYRFTTYLNEPHDSTSLLYNNVSSLHCDRQGRLWVGLSKGLQCYDMATDRFDTYHFPDGLQPRASSIIQRRDGTLLVGTAGYGVYRIDEAAHTLTRAMEYQADQGDVFFNEMYEDSEGNFWKCGANRYGYMPHNGTANVFTSQYGVPTGFITYHGKTMLICRDDFIAYENGQQCANPFDMSEASTDGGYRTALLDRQGNVYVGTRGNGLFWVPAGSNRLQRVGINAPGFDLNTAKIWSLYEDRDGNIWVGCQQKGLFLIPSRKSQFTSWSFSAQKEDIGSYVSSVCEGDNGITWCTVQNKGVYGFDPQGRIVAHPQAPSGVEFIYRDTQRDYWLGTSHGVFRYDPLTGKAQMFNNFYCDKFNTMTDDGHGRLFFSTFAKGMLVYDRQTREFTHYSMTQDEDSLLGKLCNDWIMDFQPDREGNVWIATSDGTQCFDPRTGSFQPFGFKRLGDKLVNVLCETHEGDISIGTEQGLYLWKRADRTLQAMPDDSPLATLAISYVVQDNTGDFWCATTMGIWHFIQSDQRWTNYQSGGGLTVREYVASAGMHTENDRIFFATSDGLTMFNPYQVNSVQVPSGHLQLTAFIVGGHAVSVATELNGERITEQPVSQSDHFTVSYLDNTFSLEFSLLNYGNTQNVVFEHRLNGQGEWISNDAGMNSITFRHMPSGTYKVEVRAVDDGVPSDVKTYTIVVTSPWYSTTLAYILYALFVALVLALLLIEYRKRINRRVDEEKMKFLINATHDIRSPLTLIMSPLEKLRKRVTDKESQSDLNVIDRNAKRILALVNQILDVRKIDKQQMHLHCRPTDMSNFIKTIYTVYEYNARERGIDFKFTPPTQPIVAWIDRVQFDKVVSNLLSNSFKFSDDGGSIDITLTQGHDDHARQPMRDYVELVITDSGTGMHDDTLQHLFDRFYQGRNGRGDDVEGTGIGLNLCKMIVDMHHGTITGMNRTDGQHGSVFTVRLPLGSEHLSPVEMDMNEEKPQTVKLHSKRQPSSSHRVLIVDDDEEIGRYIAAELGDYYYFTMCHNGKEGLRELLNPTTTEGTTAAGQYDLVVSDVMMPEMDGFTMLRMLRTNVNISHLPVIMLTSKSDADTRLEGLERGADAYITKPFSIDELHVTIDNLIATRLRLRGKYSGVQQPTEKVKTIEVKGNDEQLMERILKSVNDHLSDSDFNVDTICQEAGISRAHLHRKMKEMAGIPISEFIRNIRMEQAARLLKEQKLNITQVAYTVGFSSLPYFSAVFRKHFGLSPREFIEQQTD